MTEKKQSKSAITRNLLVLLFLLLSSWIIWLNCKNVWINQGKSGHTADGTENLLQQSTICCN